MDDDDRQARIRRQPTFPKAQADAQPTPPAPAVYHEARAAIDAVADPVRRIALLTMLDGLRDPDPRVQAQNARQLLDMVNGEASVTAGESVMRVEVEFV